MSRILIVEDEELVRQTIADWLELEGYEVWPAATAEAALELVEARGNPDAALVDIKLPGMNGFDLADALAQRGFARVIFVTAFFWEDATSQQLISRGAPYFQKPLKFRQEVLPFLQRYLEGLGDA